MRKKKSFKNFITSIIPYFILLFLGFYRTRVFIDGLGDEIYALNTLFYQIFIYLSLAEAGAGAYVMQLYYKYFANGDKDKIISTYNAIKRWLRKAAVAIILIGIIVSFGLKLLTNNNLSLIYMQIVFFLFLLKNAVDYLMMAPKSVIEADQKVYVINFRFYLFRIFEYIVDIVLLYFGVNYIYILIGEIITRFLTYLITNKRIFKEYPWLNDKPKEITKLKGVSNIFWLRISEAVHFNTDIIITSSFLTPLLVTIYSSYNYLTKYLTDMTDMVGNAITPSFGNSIYKDEKQNMIRIFEQINITFLYIAAFASSMVFILGNAFVKNIWLTSKYGMEFLAFILLVVNFFIVIARKPLNGYRNSKGLFKETKVIVLLEAIINLVLSLILVKPYGLTGILIATTISMVTTTLWYMPYYIYKKDLKTSVSKYFIRLLFVFTLTALISYLGYYLINVFNIHTIWGWLIFASISGIVLILFYTVIFYLFFNEFRETIAKVKDLIKRK